MGHQAYGYIFKVDHSDMEIFASLLVQAAFQREILLPKKRQFLLPKVVHFVLLKFLFVKEDTKKVELINSIARLCCPSYVCHPSVHNFKRLLF